MLPVKFQKKEQWKEWADAYIDYVEELKPAVAEQLEKAKVHPDIIEPVYPTPEDKKLAKAVFKTLKKLIHEPDEGLRILIDALRPTPQGFSLSHIALVVRRANLSGSVASCIRHPLFFA